MLPDFLLKIYQLLLNLFRKKHKRYLELLSDAPSRVKRVKISKSDLSKRLTAKPLGQLRTTLIQQQQQVDDTINLNNALNNRNLDQNSVNRIVNKVVGNIVEQRDILPEGSNLSEIFRGTVFEGLNEAQKRRLLDLMTKSDFSLRRMRLLNDFLSRADIERVDLNFFNRLMNAGVFLSKFYKGRFEDLKEFLENRRTAIPLPSPCLEQVRYYSEMFLLEFMGMLKSGFQEIVGEDSFSRMTSNIFWYGLNNSDDPARSFKLFITSFESQLLIPGNFVYIEHLLSKSVFRVSNKKLLLKGRLYSPDMEVNARDFVRFHNRTRVYVTTRKERAFFKRLFERYGRHINPHGSYGHKTYTEKNILRDFFNYFIEKHSTEQNFRDCVNMRYNENVLAVIFRPKG